MIPLPETFRSGGFEFFLVERTEDFALLKKRHKSSPRFFWEVVILTKQPDLVLWDRHMPAHEVMPSSEQWGLRGWSYPDEKSARQRYARMPNLIARIALGRTLKSKKGQDSD